MTSLTTFFLSRIIGKKVHDQSGKVIGIVKDLLIDNNSSAAKNIPGRPIVTGLKLKTRKEVKQYSFEHFEVTKIDRKIKVKCIQLVDINPDILQNSLSLVDVILDKQIVDLNGRKLVRVNDVRLVSVSEGTYTIAVDVGLEGLLRRIGIVKPIRGFLNLFNLVIPAKFILWDDVEAIDYSNLNIKLSKSYSKLHTLHPSDLADIIEDLGRKSRTELFSSLDEEKAADVLEELETHAQIHIIESLSVEKVADVFEKMPANEVADILDELEEEKAEMLLNEMEAESSQEVRELLEYSDKSVGGWMTTEVLSFNENKTVEEVIREFRDKKPEAAEMYNLFVTDNQEELIATFSLRDLIISQPENTIKDFMKTDPIFLYDDQDIDEIAEIVSKYNLLAVPVVDHNQKLQGMVVVDDIVEDLIDKRKTKKR
jgi:CBS domain-containing protein/flagellar motility protein MotE (MotC chaperone)/sporulation protein YlmC with PRC-barrel domain